MNYDDVIECVGLDYFSVSTMDSIYYCPLDTEDCEEEEDSSYDYL